MIHALTGGVGGAKLIVGLADVLPSEDLTVVVNTGDDFDYLGLHIMPDLDSVLYALAGLNDTVRGWGRAGETWTCRDAMTELGAPNWFNLGDKDLALHIVRTHLLREGQGFAAVAHTLAQRLGIPTRIIPMSDDPVSTSIISDGQEIHFQDYFVRQQCQPRADGFRFAGIETATPHPLWFDDITQGRSQGIVICPSNPFVSVAPILALPGVRESIIASGVPVVAVSPIVGGKAVKGPAAKMMSELGVDLSPVGVAEQYRGMLHGMVIDQQDLHHADALRAMGLAVAVTDTMMTAPSISFALARTVLAMISQLEPHHESQ